MANEEELEVPLDVKQIVIKEEIQSYQVAIYRLRLRYRVNKTLGNPPEVLKQIEDELEKCLKALDVLKEALIHVGEPESEAHNGHEVQQTGEEGRQ